MNIKKFATSAASVVTAGALIIGGTFAFFTDSDTSTGNTLGAGTLAIELQDLVGEPVKGPIFDAAGMFPGGPSAVACAAVANVGTLDFNYTLTGIETASTDPSLADVLWGRTYKWDGEGVPPSCDLETEGWELQGGVFASLPISPLLNQEASQGLLEDGAKTYYMWEYYLPEVLTTQPGNVVVPDQNTYQGKNTVLTFEAKAYQTNDPAGL